MRILKIEPQKEPYVKEIGNTLEAMQKEVGGRIQAVYPFEEMVAVICNEDGKIINLPVNRPLYDDVGEAYDVLYGDFFICGLSDDGFSDISKEHIDYFSEYFAYDIEKYFSNLSKIIDTEDLESLGKLFTELNKIIKYCKNPTVVYAARNIMTEYSRLFADFEINEPFRGFDTVVRFNESFELEYFISKDNEIWASGIINEGENITETLSREITKIIVETSIEEEQDGPDPSDNR